MKGKRHGAILENLYGRKKAGSSDHNICKVETCFKAGEPQSIDAFPDRSNVCWDCTKKAHVAARAAKKMENNMFY